MSESADGDQVASRAPIKHRGPLALLTVLVLLLLGAISFGILLTAEAQPGAGPPILPPLSVITNAGAPRFLFAINGVVRPLGVAVSAASERIYVTESDGERHTKVFDREGNLLMTLDPPDTDPTTRTPVYVAVDAQGQAFVSDRRAAQVYIYSATGELLGYLPSPEGASSAWAPLALAFDNEGDLLVTDVTPGQHRVILISQNGELLAQVGQYGKDIGQFSYPNGITTDRAGRIVVADSNNGRIVLLSSKGEWLWSFGNAGSSRLGLPRGLAVDNRDRLYVVDTLNHTVLVFQLHDREAKLLFSFGQQGIGDGEFNFPNGIAIDASGRIYITDRENNRVQVWTY